MRLASLLLFLLVAPLALAQPGALDATFAVGGTYSYDAPNTGAARVVVRPDGRILLVGLVQGKVTVHSLMPDGSDDTDFGSASFATFPGSEGYTVLGTALLADGSLVLSGARLGDDDTAEAAALLKLTASGAPEAGFGTEGIASFDASDGLDPTLLVAVRALPGGGFASGGGYSSEDGTEAGVITAHFTASGALDASYGTGGIVRAASESGIVAFGGAFDASGAMVLTGGAAVEGGGVFDLNAAVARILPDGSLDSEFGTDGVVSFSGGLPFSIVLDAAVDSEGRILGVGATIDLFGGASEAVVLRLLADGSLDPAFASGGLFRTTAGASIAQGAAVALQSDGKVLFGGSVGTEEAPDTLVGRLTASGALDTTFGTDGFTRVSFGAESLGTDLVLQAGGRIVVTGQRGDGNTDPLGMVVARLQNDDLGTAGEAPARSGPLALSLAGPNPFARGTAVAVEMAEPLAARVTVYDALGREVATLHDGPLAPGRTVLAFEGGDLAPGTYMIRARTGAVSSVIGLVRR